MTEGEGSPRPWTGSGAECICKDEDQDVLLPGWCLLQTALHHHRKEPTAEGTPTT